MIDPKSANIDELLNEIANRYQQLKKEVSLARHAENFSPIYEAGERIRVERKKQKLTQTDLCDLSGVAYATLNKIEQGHPSVRLDSLDSVCRALGMKLWIG